MIVFSFVITVFIALFIIVASRGGQIFNQEAFGQAQLVAETVAQQINSAVSAGNGYSANLTITNGYGVNNYNISVLQNGEVIVYAAEGSQKIQSVAYSQAKSLLVSNTISTGYMTIQNYMGLICIDTACPSPAGTASSLSLSTQGAYSARFNGYTSYVSTGHTNIPTGSNAVSAFGWIYYTGNSLSNSYYTIYSYGSDSNDEQVSLSVFDGYLNLGEYGYTGFTSALQVKQDTWYFVGYTYNSAAGLATLYLNGQSESSSVPGFSIAMPSYNQSVIGSSSQVTGSYFSGEIANLQVYNSALSAAQEDSLYSEGITGAPVAPANVVAWWQLNGDTADYSGNNNTGTPYAVVFSTVAQISAKVTNSKGAGLNGVLVGFTATNGTLAKGQFAANYTNSNGMAYAFLTQNFTNARAVVTATAYAGGMGEQGNLTLWWPLDKDAYDISGNNNTGEANNVVWVVNAPQQVKYYVPVSLANGQNAPTPLGFQQELTVNSLAYNSFESNTLQNIEFFYANGTVIPSWLESGNSNTATNTIYWLKIAPQIAQGSTLTVYMGFAQPSVNIMNNITTGEAPQLSPKYGQYDDGANVFTYYGGGGPTGWSRFTFIGGTWTSANGYLQQTASTGSYSGGPAALIEGNLYPAAGMYVLGMAFNYTTNADARVGIMAVATPTSAPDAFGYRFIGQASSNGNGFISFLNDLVAWSVSGSYQGAVNTAYTMTITDAGGVWSGNLYSGYAEGGTALTSLAQTNYINNNYEGTSTGYVGISAAIISGANPINVQWFYLRSYPPNGVMPTASFGNIYSAPQYLSGYGAVFNGRSSYIAANVPGVNTISGGYNTASFWMYWSGANGISGDGMIPFSLGSSSYLLLYNGCFGFSSAHSDVYGISSNSLAKGWLYVTAQLYNGAYTGNDRLYMDGVPQGLSQCTGSANSATASNSLGLGYESGSSALYFLNGSISNLQLYGTGINSTQAYQLYAGGVPPSASVTVQLGGLNYP